MIMKLRNTTSKERTMQSLHLNFAKQEFKNSIKKNWRYLIFSHINRFDSLTELNQNRRVRICIFRIDVCSQCMSRIWCNLFISISRSSSTFHISLTYFMNFLQSNCINIESLMLQEVFENFKTQWCYQIMMWFALSLISLYSNKRYLLHDVSFTQF